MGIYVNINGVNKPVTQPSVNINGTWKNVSDVYNNINGVWKTSYPTPFTITKDNRSMIGYTDTTTKLVIPETFVYGGVKYKVTAIGVFAFKGCSSLTSITIPNSVTNIYNAFSGCKSLTSITIPNSVTVINDGTFNGCSSLTSITIPSGVTNIEKYAFYGCRSLTTVYYRGTQEQWNNIAISTGGNDPLINATKVYNYTS